ncbi:Vesicle transport v-SNARE protein [Tritrichomonas foetus]|uniref:Vesicle transport v-SNARE protein n=1 Tax=Tritrichomonas foetus TaxID=1144522 RepID=A0A1J4KAL5_9EUKA|nr:Vesicle transport v-SNARE protein [Tritrichomonas foetus]|eukprot:OHT06702.1 Vesicle transport v-SNARE protein [Tritrichomonas foetus]
MSSCSEYERDLQRITSQIAQGIAQVGNLQGTQRQEKVRQIESDFNTIDEIISSINEEKIMWESSDTLRINRILQDKDLEIRRLRDRFQESLNRENLFAGAMHLDGGSAAQRNTLTGQRQEIEKGNGMVDSFNQNVNDIKEVGTGILTEMSSQKYKEDMIGGRLDELGTEISIGEKVTDRMLCRQKRRTAIIWILVVIVVIVFLSVFLYFVFRP